MSDFPEAHDSLREILGAEMIEGYVASLKDTEFDKETKEAIESGELAYKDNRALCARMAVMFVQGYRKAEIMEALHIGRKTYDAVRFSDEYKALVASLTEEVVSTARSFMATAALKAVRTLVTCLDSPNEKVKLDAAKEVLNRVGVKAKDEVTIISKNDPISTLSEEQLIALVKLGMNDLIINVDVEEHELTEE